MHLLQICVLFLSSGPEDSFLQHCCWKQPRSRVPRWVSRVWWSNADQHGAFSMPQWPPCSAELPGPCCAPHTLLWTAPAHHGRFRLDFSLKAGTPSEKCGSYTSLSEWPCYMSASGMAIFFIEFGIIFSLKRLRKYPAFQFSLYVKMHKSSFPFPASDFSKNP